MPKPYWISTIAWNDASKSRTRELDQAYDAMEFALDSAAMGSWDIDLTDTSWPADATA